MLGTCTDVFREYDLPFETYFAKEIEHDYDVHDELELLWLIKGNAVVSCDDTEYRLTDQTLFMVYMNRRHSVKTEDGSILISYRFKKDHIAQNRLLFEQIPFSQRVYTFSELWNKYHAVPLLIFQLLKLLLSPNPSPIIRYKIIGYYNLFLHELYNMLLKEKYLDIKTVNSDPFLLRIHTLVEYIHAHAHEKITLQQLAELTNLSTYRLSHFMKEALGISFSEFLQNTRFESALWRLRNSELRVAEIAKLSGFSDVKYLNRMMKERFHMTATKYRKVLAADHHEMRQITVMTDFAKELKACLRQIEEDPCFTETFGVLLKG